MIHGFAIGVRTAAAPHVSSMHYITALQRKLRHTAHVSGITGAFESMNHEDVTLGSGGRTLCMNEDPNVRLGLMIMLFNREAGGV